MERDDMIKVCGTKGVVGITFLKRDKSVRRMAARLGVTKHLSGVGKTYEDEDHNIVTVYDMNKKGYRSIRADSVLKIKKGGKVIYQNKVLEKELGNVD